MCLRVSEKPLKTAKKTEQEIKGFRWVFPAWASVQSNWERKSPVEESNKWLEKEEGEMGKGRLCFVYVTLFVVFCIVNEVKVSAFLLLYFDVIEIFQIPFFSPSHMEFIGLNYNGHQGMRILLLYAVDCRLFCWYICSF